MLIIWGTRGRTEHLGTVADWCDVCRCVRPFCVTSHFEVSHIYFIPLGRGSLLATVATCHQCSFEFECEADDYDDFLPNKRADQTSLSDLLAQTNSRLKTHLLSRGAGEDALRAALPLDADLDARGRQLEGVKFTVPSGWTEKAVNGGVALLAPEEGNWQANLFLEVREDAERRTLKRALADLARNLEDRKERFHEVNRAVERLSGGFCFGRIEYTCTYQRIPLTEWEILIELDGEKRLFVLASSRAGLWNKYRSVFEAFLDSLRMPLNDERKPLTYAEPEPFREEPRARAPARPPTPAPLPASAGGTKLCPFCSEEIKATAVKCRFCGEFLD